MMKNGDEPDVFGQFWEARGSDCVKIIKAMSAKDVWQLDDALKATIDDLCFSINDGGIAERLETISQQDYIEMMSWLSSEKSLVLLSEFEKAKEGMTAELLQLSNMKLGAAFKVFVERINTFSRAKLLSELFSEERIQRIEKAARGALRQC